jgi:pimeloyl-ACP methyl ester carboxylesterase
MDAGQVGFERFTVAARGGGRIAVATAGAGRDLVFVNGLSADDFYWRPLFPRLAQAGRLTVWDLPGHGRSEPAPRPAELSIADCADTLGRVLDAVGARRAVVLGFSLGCQIALEAWRTMADRIEALVLALGPFERPFDRVLHPLVGPLIARAIRRLDHRAATLAMKGTAFVSLLPGAFEASRAARFVGPGTNAAAMRPYFEQLAAIDGPTWAGLAVAAQRHSAADVLPTIDVPVLIVSGGRDVFTPPAASAHMAATIPHARRVHFATAAHTGLVEHPDEVAAAILRFLRDCPPAAP